MVAINTRLLNNSIWFVSPAGSFSDTHVIGFRQGSMLGPFYMIQRVHSSLVGTILCTCKQYHADGTQSMSFSSREDSACKMALQKYTKLVLLICNLCDLVKMHR